MVLSSVTVQPILMDILWCSLQVHVSADVLLVLSEKSGGGGTSDTCFPAEHQVTTYTQNLVP